MESLEDIRWQQRFDSYQKALKKIVEVVDSHSDFNELSDLEKEGLIQRFEYTFELSWKTLQDLLKYKGYIDIKGPNMVLQKSLEDGYIQDHDGWRAMKKARETTSHTYNEGDAGEIVANIFGKYAPLFKDLESVLLKECQKQSNNLF